jgi:hypothetical protein
MGLEAVVFKLWMLYEAFFDWIKLFPEPLWTKIVIFGCKNETKLLKHKILFKSQVITHSSKTVIIGDLHRK